MCHIIGPLDAHTGKSVKKFRLHASPTASDSSTIAEELIVLIRRLHPLDGWNKLINQYISHSLQAIPSLVLPVDSINPVLRKFMSTSEQVGMPS